MKKERLNKYKSQGRNRKSLKELTLSEEDYFELEHSVQLFNECNFLHAREAWEILLERHKKDKRVFFQGLIKLATAYHQLTTQNKVRTFIKAIPNIIKVLKPFQPKYLGINVENLISLLNFVKKETEQNRAKPLEEFKQQLIIKLQYYKRGNPDLAVELEEALKDNSFLEGARLFNLGYYWEAHELFEELCRDKEGDIKIFIQSFGQMASAYNFLKTFRLSSSQYLFEKAIQNMALFQDTVTQLPLADYIRAMEDNLRKLKEACHTNSLQIKITKPPDIVLPIVL